MTVRIKKPEAGTHDTGDLVEFSVTEHVRAKGGRETWLKAGTTVTVRPGESGDDAIDRAATFVTKHIQEAINTL